MARIRGTKNITPYADGGSVGVDTGVGAGVGTPGGSVRGGVAVLDNGIGARPHGQ